MPQLAGPGGEIRRMLAERRARERVVMAEAEEARYAAVRAAFAEGWRAGDAWLDPKEAWRASAAWAAIYPPVRTPTDAMRQMLHERKITSGSGHDEAYADRFYRRWEEIEAAFAEGHAVGAAAVKIKIGWAYGQTRRALYPGPPCPVHLMARLRAMGFPADPRRRNAA